ncbi:MAG: hypothetical protein UDO44_11625, partial [Prevotella sp.]|nr:hypothetical protein [Prevotella sp.]
TSAVVLPAQGPPVSTIFLIVFIILFFVIIRCVMGCVKRPHSFYGCKDSNKFFKKEKNFRFFIL